MKIVKKKSSENYNFYSREILQYIARTCLRNGVKSKGLVWWDLNHIGVLV